MRYPAEEAEVKGFDTRVTHRDPKTGLVVKKDPYIKRVCREEGVGSNRYYERPAGSGNLWDKQGKPVGRWDHTQPEGARFVKGAKHIDWAPPETEDDKLAKALIQKDHENAALRAELAALKAEQEKAAEEKKEQEPKSSLFGGRDKRRES